MYALTALIALNSPALAGYLPVILQVGNFVSVPTAGFPKEASLSCDTEVPVGII